MRFHTKAREFGSPLHERRAGRSSKTMAGEGGFEPPNGGSKGRCLTTWRLPNRSCLQDGGPDDHSRAGSIWGCELPVASCQLPVPGARCPVPGARCPGREVTIDSTNYQDRITKPESC